MLSTHNVSAPTVATTLTATFNQLYQLIATATAGGRVATSPVSADGYYAANSTVTLTATADANYCLSSWGGVMPVASYAIAVSLLVPPPSPRTSSGVRCRGRCCYFDPRRRAGYPQHQRHFRMSVASLHRCELDHDRRCFYGDDCRTAETADRYGYCV